MFAWVCSLAGKVDGDFAFLNVNFPAFPRSSADCPRGILLPFLIPDPFCSVNPIRERNFILD